jgi:hypothetical protein
MPDSLTGAVQHLAEVNLLAVRLRLAGLQARHVEQVLDQAREPLALGDNRLAQLGPLALGERHRTERRAAGDH